MSPSPASRTSDADVYDRIRNEIGAYDAIARQRSRQGIESATRSLLGGNLLNGFRSGEYLGRFPSPPGIWLDSIANPVSQYQAYDWLAPVDERVFLQLGGSGSHAIKALIAGANMSLLLTPMSGEGLVGTRIARHLKLEKNLRVVQAIGEQIPLPDCSVDLIFGGGTLHHIDLERGLSEIARVLRPGGRAAFVDPCLNFVYRMLEATRIRNLAREPGAQCYPLRLNEVSRHFSGFSDAAAMLSGGPSRYAAIGITRVLKMTFPLELSLAVQRVETRMLRRLGLKSMLGGLAILLEK